MRLIYGDCLEVMQGLDPESVDTIITDPPYALEFMGKSWDKVLPSVEVWLEALRVAKPGAFLLAFGSPRTYHRLACSIEDAGWEIRDCLMWLYGSGWPKSLDISKALDKAAGAEREVVGPDPQVSRRNKTTSKFSGCYGEINDAETCSITAPTTEDAKRWSGFGTGLKPSYEPIVLAMKPLDGTFVENALEHEVAGLNIDGCRVESKGETYNRALATGGFNEGFDGYKKGTGRQADAEGPGRWPPNVVLDVEAAESLDAQSGVLTSGALSPENNVKASTGWSGGSYPDRVKSTFVPNEGGASRFFPQVNFEGEDRFLYCSKAPSFERFVYLICDCETPRLSAWGRQGQSQQDRMAITSRNKGTSEIELTAVCGSNTSLSGSRQTDYSPQGFKSIISMKTNSIVDCQTSSSLLQQSTNESTRGANSEMGNGGNPANSVETTSPSRRSIGTSQKRGGRSMGVAVSAISAKLLSGSVCVECGAKVKGEGHPTQKPIKLMEWLCKLTKTPTGGVVLDPFMGSGTTGIACLRTKRDFIGIEKDEHSFEIVQKRLADPPPAEPAPLRLSSEVPSGCRW